MRSNPNGRLPVVAPEILPGNTLTISVGRNVGSTPMSDDDWLTFRSVVSFAIGATVGRHDTIHSGTGIWNGVPEDSTIWTLFTPRPYLSKLVEELAEVARAFDQDTIAVTIGQPIVVTAAAGDDRVPSTRSELAGDVTVESFTGPRAEL